MKNASELLDSLIKDARQKYNINIYTKKRYYRFWKFLAVLFKIVTFGKAGDFLKNYTITFGTSIYFPLDWDFKTDAALSYTILRHELVHVVQYRKLGLGCVPLGVAVFLLLYCLVPIPICFAWFRYRLERSAYLETCKARRYIGLPLNIDYYVDSLSGPRYLWTWVLKKQIKKWFYRKLSTLPKEPPSAR